MKKKLGPCLLFLAVVFSFHTAFSQDVALREIPLNFSVGVSSNYGTVLAHSDKLEKVSKATTLGFTAAFNWHRTDQEVFNFYHCLPRYSLNISYYDFGKSILGHGVIVSYSLEPHFMMSDRVSIYPKLSAGLGLLSNPNDSIDNPNNLAYSLPLNVYLSLGGGVRWQFSKRSAMNLQVQFQHISNGGLHLPNIGMNWPTVGFGLEYSPEGFALKKYDRSGWIKEKVHSNRFDIQLFGVMKHGDFSGEGKYYPIVGLNFTRSWQVSRINAWTAALEGYQDQHLQERAKMRNDSFNGIRLGILAGHEFLLGKYLFSQQIGFYFVGAYRDNLIYHRWGLQYFFLPKWSAGFNLLVHGQTADFTDLRLTYSLVKK